MINFICDPCKKAGSKETIAEKEAWHLACPGDTRCTCQHRVGKKNV